MAGWPNQSERLKGAPTKLFEDILDQKGHCNRLLQSKNNIIEVLEEENRLADESYKQLMEDYKINMSELSGRMENQVGKVEEVLGGQRKRLQNEFNRQKKHQLQRGELDWEAILGKARDTCEKGMENRLGLVEEQEQELDELIATDYEVDFT